MKILAIDVGRKKIGMAIGDTDIGIAFARDILQLDQTEKPFQILLEFSRKEKIEKILVGHPGALTETGTTQAEYCRNFADGLEDFFLEQNVHIPVEFIDESFSSQIAQKQLKEAGASNKKQDDALAAAAFLQVFLERKEEQGNL